LHAENFPIPLALLSLHCLPVEPISSQKAMWAHGCYYACESKIGPANVAFACGIMEITPQLVTAVIEVGILRDTILIQYGKFSSMVL
jgi:hypothetical protein